MGHIVKFIKLQGIFVPHDTLYTINIFLPQTVAQSIGDHATCTSLNPPSSFYADMLKNKIKSIYFVPYIYIILKIFFLKK